jgi:NAD+ synthase (glutamine-hydrolysing)
VLAEVLKTPISPELLPPQLGQIRQKTEETIGPYELHDFFLYYFVRYGFSFSKIRFLALSAFGAVYSPEVIEKWLRLFFQRFMRNQWKRDCVAAGPKVGSIDLSPRGSWRMPSEIDPLVFLEGDACSSDGNPQEGT